MGNDESGFFDIRRAAPTISASRTARWTVTA